MELRFERIDDATRGAYERFFFEKICSMNVGDREDFTIPLEQIDGLYFTSVQDTVERLTQFKKLSVFQWRNCIFAPISESVKLRDIYGQVFAELKSKVPSLFVRSYVYLIFIKLKSSGAEPLDFGESVQPTAVRPTEDDFQIYYWNTKYEVNRTRKKNLFGDLGTDVTKVDDESSDGSGEDDAGVTENDPKKLFVVADPAHELQRILDANSDIIDAVRSFTADLGLFDQTKNYHDEITDILDSSKNARVLVEGPARSGKTVLAMSLLARYPKSKMLLMNWYFYRALNEAFKVMAVLPADEIEQLFAMSQETSACVEARRRKHEEFRAYLNDPRLIDVALKAILRTPDRLPKWHPYTGGQPTGKGEIAEEFRAKPVTRCCAGDLVPVRSARGDRVEIVEVKKRYDDDSAAVDRLSPPIYLDLGDQDLDARLREYRSQIEAKQGEQYAAELLKDVATALHNSPQRFFHHDLDPKRHNGCWIKRGKPTLCRISNQDLVICDEVQRLGVIPAIPGRDEFDEAQAIIDNSKQTFLCGDDFQMLNYKYDQGIGAIEQLAGTGVTRLRLPDSIGVPAEVGELIKYLLDEHSKPERRSGFEIQLLYRDDARLIELFEADGSPKKHYAIPNNWGFYAKEPYILRPICPEHGASPCVSGCTGRMIPMLPEELLKSKFEFFCAEQIMPNNALSAYELISREVDSIYIKLPARIGLDVLKQSMAPGSPTAHRIEYWMKHHLYVLMTRATMRLVISVDDRDLFEELSRRLRAASNL